MGLEARLLLDVVDAFFVVLVEDAFLLEEGFFGEEWPEVFVDELAFFDSGF